MNLTVTSADASWKWHNEKLSGTLALNTAPYGQTGAHFTLPIPARFPVAVTPQLPLQGAINGHLQEQGILSTLFPEYVQKSFGSIDVAVAVGGTWEAPLIGGRLKLAKAGAYLPTTGITLKDVQFSAYLEKNRIRIDSFRALSGSGHIEGNALITLDGWRVAGYQGVINGENFQTVYLPELRIMSSPKLSFEGAPQKLTLRGELRIPELQFDGAQTRTVISPSNDVILEGIIVPLAARSPLIVDGQIRVLIGERVFAKVAGIDAQLGGGMDLSFSALDNITSRGEITVVKGHYRTYGVDLEIIRGRLFFAGGPIDQPSLDFLALRTVGDVKAGVTVAGSIQKPMIKLYAEPAMPDVDILAYIVLGHPYASNGEQAGLMTKAAGALLTSGQASEIQDQLKNQLGLSTLEIQGGVGAPGGSMGYKPLQSTVPGALPSGATDTVLTVGKYLTPQLYISYGKSLFTGTNLFLLRYDIFKQWQIETQTGSESGADLFYKLEFK
jgi:translocation and assembly module TamB